MSVVEDFDEALKKRRESATAAGGKAQDGRVIVQLEEERFNEIVRQCAALLRNQIYIRGVLPFAITRAADVAGGRQVEDDDGTAVEIAGVRHRPGALVFTGAERERVAFLPARRRPRALRPSSCYPPRRGCRR
jgi:hypothetical protein